MYATKIYTKTMVTLARLQYEAVSEDNFVEVPEVNIPCIVVEGKIYPVTKFYENNYRIHLNNDIWSSDYKAAEIMLKYIGNELTSCLFYISYDISLYFDFTYKFIILNIGDDRETFSDVNFDELNFNELDFDDNMNRVYCTELGVKFKSILDGYKKEFNVYKLICLARPKKDNVVTLY